MCTINPFEPVTNLGQFVVPRSVWSSNQYIPFPSKDRKSSHIKASASTHAFHSSKAIRYVNAIGSGPKSMPKNYQKKINACSTDVSGYNTWIDNLEKIGTMVLTFKLRSITVDFLWSSVGMPVMSRYILHKVFERHTAVSLPRVFMTDITKALTSCWLWWWWFEYFWELWLHKGWPLTERLHSLL